jgi:hypothetical protein
VGAKEKIEGRHFSALLYYVTNTELAAIKEGSHAEKLTVIYIIIIIIICVAAQCCNNEKPLGDATPSCSPQGAQTYRAIAIVYALLRLLLLLLLLLLL